MVERIARADASVVHVPRIPSLALRLVRAATGELDGALASGDSHDWDLAAADLILHEAGGFLTELDGSIPRYDRPEPVHGALVAAGHALHSLLLQALAEPPSRQRETGRARKRGGSSAA
jgi:myo-inositol-1(or 4)-monophosphatase